MPITENFEIQNTNYSTRGIVVDFSENTSPTITKHTGVVEEKKKGQKYIDAKIQVSDGPDKGKEFVYENLNTSLYRWSGGRSYMWMFLLALGYDDSEIDEMSKSEKFTLNLMSKVGTEINIIRKSSAGDFYLALKDTEATPTSYSDSFESGDQVIDDGTNLF